MINKIFYNQSQNTQSSNQTWNDQGQQNSQNTSSSSTNSSNSNNTIQNLFNGWQQSQSSQTSESNNQSYVPSWQNLQSHPQVSEQQGPITRLDSSLQNALQAWAAQSTNSTEGLVLKGSNVDTSQAINLPQPVSLSVTDQLKHIASKYTSNPVQAAAYHKAIDLSLIHI